MAIIKPFHAVRPNPAVADQVAALPYDVYSRSEACTITAEHPLSFLNIDRAETQFDNSVGTYDDCVYEKAKELLIARIADQTFLTDNSACYYIYELTMDGRRQTGIVGCSSIDDYANGIIKKHENTRADKERDRIRHIDTCSAQTGPIFLAYRSNRTINTLIELAKQSTPVYNFCSEDGIRHTVWTIDDSKTIGQLESAFEAIPNTYIADGHHRAASAVKVGFKRREEYPDYDGTEQFNYFLSVLFPDDQLFIMPYNRVVHDLNGMDTEQFLSAVSKSFTVTPADIPVSPASKGCFGMFLEDQWYELQIHDDLKNADPVKGLDVSLLQDYLLNPLLGIKDPRTDDRIQFIGGIRGLSELERRCQDDAKVAFSMYPTSIDELFQVADADLLMPPKSTWFEPKLRSGLFIHPFEERLYPFTDLDK